MTLSRQIATTVVTKGVQIDDLVEALRKYDLLALLPSIKKDIEKLAKEGEKKEIIAIESPFPLDARAIAAVKRIVSQLTLQPIGIPLTLTTFSVGYAIAFDSFHSFVTAGVSNLHDPLLESRQKKRLNK